MSHPKNLDLLVAQAACSRLVLLAAALTDNGEFAKLAELFAPEASLHRPNGDVLKGRQAIVDSYAKRAADRVTCHLILNTLVTDSLDDRISAKSQALVWNAIKTDAAGPFGRPARGKEVVGHFVDTFIRVGEDWQIETRRAEFVMFRETDN
ncbi:nuclear transport factor 2 family protein [Paraburkholderia tuberum]|uniref:SnoaL-like domain-containing protein n=1 Tax=Paraburkholderia tuberum TaxID=157910 RepID=A0A1H1KG09_9BURK|nr:nuclear transport factor 2 family protein [Paraburkholderia tuberum]SDR60910.1 SnoaL-like domain-containing protein [Paraburkholderia tuberum]